MATYLYQLPDWSLFHWDSAKLAEPLAAVRHRQGRLIGQMEGLGFNLRQEAILRTLTDDVLKTSEIEGERLDAEQVRSSIARRLGMDIGALKAADGNVDGIVETMLDATRNYRQPLTEERLFAWHTSLFPTGRSVMPKIKVGAWRDDSGGPMQVVSGAIGHERVYYEAPPAGKLDQEMTAFLEWFNASPDMDQVLKAALAHLWFVTIHPFDDGNGRIARAIADMTLARTQDESMDVTAWMEWFLSCLGRAIDGAQAALSGVLAKARFWESVAGISLNERQKLVLNRLLDGFEGKLTNAKWVKLAKCSPDTALRDLQYLVESGVLTKGPDGGRSTSYMLVPR